METIARAKYIHTESKRNPDKRSLKKEASEIYPSQKERYKIRTPTGIRTLSEKLKNDGVQQNILQVTPEKRKS